LSRDLSGHVGFGFGIHQCVDQHVARLEAEALLTAPASRVEQLELAGPTRRHHDDTLRAWESMPMRVDLVHVAGFGALCATPGCSHASGIAMP
jgi:cytochrome P450